MLTMNLIPKSRHKTLLLTAVITIALTFYLINFDGERAFNILNRYNAKKWITVWVPSDVEVDVSHLTSIPGWKTVAVGDGVPPKGCRKPSCVFLDPVSQTALGSSLAPLLPPNNPAKKNLAYLYAIKQGAHFIYDTNINIRPLHNLNDFFYGNTSGLVYTGKGLFNYYEHYGEHLFQPPGFGDFSNKKNNPYDFVLSDLPQPEVQYGLVNVMDNSGPRFQSMVPTVFVGSHSFAPFDSSNTMFHKRAFWGMLFFPCKGRDLLRSFILQTLLKYIRGYVGFLHPNAQQEQYLRAQNRKKTNELPNGLMLFLYKWQCRGNRSLRTCFAQLASDLMARRYITENHWLMIEAWMFDLMTTDYTASDMDIHEPVKLIHKTNRLNATAEIFKYTPKNFWLNKTGMIEGSLVPVEFSPTPSVYYSNNPETHTHDYVTSMCKTFSYSNHVPYQFDDILLIVTFNYPFLYININFIEAVYRRYFPHILLCGPDINAFRSAVTSLPVNSSVAYVTGIERGWMYFQECTVYAMKMNFNVKGYLQIGEDTLVNAWNLRNISRDKLWFIAETYEASRASTEDEEWFYWPRPFGKKALNMTFDHIAAIAKNPEDTKEKGFFNHYVRNVKNFDNIYHKSCDFFYIPNRLKEDFIYFTRLFFNFTALVEAVIPTMILGLDDEENIVRVKGTVVWGKKRRSHRETFDPDSHYLHPFKGLQYMANTKGRGFICKTFLPTLVKRMDARINND